STQRAPLTRCGSRVVRGLLPARRPPVSCGEQFVQPRHCLLDKHLDQQSDLGGQSCQTVLVVRCGVVGSRGSHQPSFPSVTRCTDNPVESASAVVTRQVRNGVGNAISRRYPSTVMASSSSTRANPIAASGSSGTARRSS